MRREMVVLVDENDRPIGVSEKLAAHRKGLLHRAFSIFIFNEQGHMLLQKRAEHKYHSGGLWSNACCSHPRPGESLLQAVRRRLREELGITCPIKKAFDFIYRIHLTRGLIEHELDHVFYGLYNGKIHPNPDEVADYRWMKIDSLLSSLRFQPEKYTEWFKIILHEHDLLGRLRAVLRKDNG